MGVNVQYNGTLGRKTDIMVGHASVIEDTVKGGQETMKTTSKINKFIRKFKKGS